MSSSKRVDERSETPASEQRDVDAGKTSGWSNPFSTGVIWKGTEHLRELLVDISTLTEHSENIDKHHVDVIADSLLRFGQVRPVLVNEDNVLHAGHHVVKAARMLGWSHVAVSRATFKSDEEAYAYLVADNETAARGRESIQINGQVSMVEQIYERTGSLDGTGWTSEQLADYQALTLHKTEMMPAAELRQHPQNYRKHPKDQLEHLTRSLKEHGFYRNVVVARDGTVLAGHGIVEAAREIGLNNVPVTRLDIDRDSVEALKIMAGDNELSRLGEMDDRQLAELLKAAHDDVTGLAGTGFDPQTLASLLLVTRRRDEIADVKHAFEWVGLPEFVEDRPATRVVVQFDSDEDREEFLDLIGIVRFKGATTKTIMFRWPDQDQNENTALRFEFDDGEG